MKKRIITILIVLLVLISVGFFIYSIPKRFGGNLTADDVATIEIQDGTNGNHFFISNREDIKYIVNNIQSHPMKRGKISLFYMGYLFHIWYLDGNDKVLAYFILNGDNVIRKDPFFYSCDGGLCSEYIYKLEQQYK